MNKAYSFYSKVGGQKILIYVLLIVTLVIMIINFQIYDPIYGYDARDHFYYIDYFSMYLPDTINFPTIEDSKEFFSPPLPYIVPSTVIIFCRNIIESSNFVEDCRPYMSKITQIFQIIIFFLCLYIYTKIAKKLYPKSKEASGVILLLILLQTVNYRTFLMIRGEPYILLFQSLILYFLITKLTEKKDFRLREYFYFGLLIGLIGLSKQWAFLLFPSYFLILFFLKEKKAKKEFFRFLVITFSIGFLIFGGFYLNLYLESGSPIAFNKEPQTFNLKNQPLDFYFSFEPNTYLFQNPIRPHYDNKFFPIIYSDLWGDYWGYFSFILKGWDYGRNQENIGSYLGRVNLVSIIPTVIYMLGFISCSKLLLKKNKNEREIFKTLIQLGVAVTFVGYLWFLIKYPERPSGDTIKATYIIQAFHLLAFLGLDYIEKIKEKSIKSYILILGALLFVYFHNIPAMITNYI